MIRRATYPRPTSSIAILWFLGSLLFGSCTPAPDVPDSFRVPLLSTVSEAEVSYERYQTITSEEGFKTWEVEFQRRYFLRPSPLLESKGDKSVNFRGHGAKTIVSRGKFDPSQFNTLKIKLLSQGNMRVSAYFERDGKQVTQTIQALVKRTTTPTIAEFRFHRNQFQTEPFDALHLHFAAEGYALSIYELELGFKEGFPEYAVTDETPKLTFLKQDGRRAWAVTTIATAQAEFEIREGSEVSFSYGIPDELYYADSNLALKIRLSHEDGETRESEFRPAPDKWQLGRISLDDWPAGKVTAELSLDTTNYFSSACLVTQFWISTATSRPPTVLFITSDTHRADHLGTAGLGVVVETPIIDALAERGVLFERAWSTTNATIPSHVALMTGKHPRDTRVIDNMNSVSREASTLAEQFRDQGWSTMSLVSVRHLADRYSGLGQGFERMLAPLEEERTADGTIDALEQWLDESEQRPLFIWLHLFDAHTPYNRQVPWIAEYDGTEEPDKVTDIHAGKDKRARYRSEVSYLDQELDRILSRPRIQDGVVAFTSDHGEVLGAHDIYFIHYELYPDTTHVPLILSWPDGPKGLRITESTPQLNLGRTILNLAGLHDVEFPGYDLTQHLEQPRDEPIYALATYAHAASVLEDDWLFILSLVKHKIPHDPEPPHVIAAHVVELYNLAVDPKCTQDLSKSETSRTPAMRKQLVRWLRKADPVGLKKKAYIDPEAMEALLKLGYSGDDTSYADAWFDEECECEHCIPFRE